MTTRVARKNTKPETKKARKKGTSPAKIKAPKPKANTKTAMVLDLLKRDKGATLAEIAKATKWQNHSIRGFISATVGKKLGLKVESTRNDDGERRYRVVA